MARPKTSKQRPPKAPPEIEGTETEVTRKDAAADIPDAEVIGETPPTTVAPAPETRDAAVTETAVEPSPLSEAAAPEPTVLDTTAAQDAEHVPAPEAIATDAPPSRDTPQSRAPEPPTQKAEPAPHAEMSAPPAPKQSASFLTLLLGGAVAAALGYGAHMLTQTSAAPDLQGQITELRRIIAALPAPEPAPVPAPAFDPTDLIARLDALESAEPVAPDLSSLTEQLADLSAQIAALQSAQSSVQDSVLAATAGQRDALGAFAADIAQVQADLEDLRALATERVQAAQAARDMALAQAGLDQLRAALVTGAPFAGALAQITEAGFALPDALAGRQGGVATIDALTETFPAAARAGLRASLLDAPATSTTERLGNFLRAQVGAMSTSPRPGDDIDAILSRAGAAMVEGDVAAALAELALLPETARAPMADWIDAATARQNALAALEALAADIAP